MSSFIASIIQDPKQLTPVEKYDFYIKREDLYYPYGLGDISGGKCRQALGIVLKNQKEIEEKYNKTIILQAGVQSTTSVIYSSICQKMGYKCIVCVGGINENSIEKNPSLKQCAEFGSEIRCLTKHGMPAPIIKRMKEIAKKESYFIGNFQVNLETSPEAVVGEIANQVENIPDNLEYLVVPVGSGLQYLGILKGISQFNKNIKNIYGICVGPSRYADIIDGIKRLQINAPKFEVVCLEKNVYAKKCDVVYKNIRLDELYEAKVYNWLIKNVKDLNNTLFWNVGLRMSQYKI